MSRINSIWAADISIGFLNRWQAILPWIIWIIIEWTKRSIRFCTAVDRFQRLLWIAALIISAILTACLKNTPILLLFSTETEDSDLSGSIDNERQRDFWEMHAPVGPILYFWMIYHISFLIALCACRRSSWIAVLVLESSVFYNKRPNCSKEQLGRLL